MRRPKITGIRATTVAVPLIAPLRTSNGAHWGRFVRTIVEVETDVGLIGLGEMGGGGESSEAAIAGLKSYLVGHDPFELEALRFKIRAQKEVVGTPGTSPVVRAFASPDAGSLALD